MHHGPPGGPPPPGMPQQQPQQAWPAPQTMAAMNEAVWLQIGKMICIQSLFCESHSLTVGAREFC